MTRFWITLDQAVDLVLKGFSHMQGGEIFIPIVPSMKIMHLAQAIAPGCEIDIIGIRPGEKLHEALTTEDDGRYTVAFDGMYVVLPNHAWWERKNYTEAIRLPENFVYTSNHNKHWLTVDDLRAIVSRLVDTMGIDRRGLVGVKQ
jgi:UDP-N-acetylglucosamine 4,6-dehydratase